MAAASLPSPAAPEPSSQPWLQRLLPASVVLHWPLLQRLLVTMAMLAVIRCGYYVPLPGVDMQLMPALGGMATRGERMMRALYGQAQELPACLFDVGISPHINAGIIVSVVFMLPKAMLPPWLQRLHDARKEGKSGEAFINDKINWLALLFALYTSCLRGFELLPYALFNHWFVSRTMLALVAGTLAIHHCANTISANGIGNGSTLVICLGIITDFADTLHQVLSGVEASAVAAWQLLAIGAGYLAMLLFTVYLSSTEVRLPIVQYSTTPTQLPQGAPSGTGSRQELYLVARSLLDRKALEAGNQSSYFPILLNSSGVMPMIFASVAYYAFIPKLLELAGLGAAAGAVYGFQSTLPGLLLYGVLVFAMEFLPFGAVNPPEVAEYFSAINVGIKGVAPGADTVAHLQAKVRQCKFWGGLALGGLAVSAQLFDAACQQVIGATLATTSLIIIVGAVLQTSRQVASLLDGPRLQQKLDKERCVIQSLNFM